MNEHIQGYSRLNPFIAKIKSREDLCYSCNKKTTQHIVIDIHGSGIAYEVGDCVGIFPVNDPVLLSRTLEAMHATGEEMITDARSGNSFLLRDFLSMKANVTDIGRNLLKEVADREPDLRKKEELEQLLIPQHSHKLKEYLFGKHLWDILLYHSESVFTPQELCDMLMPLLPRFYSIASSQKAVGDEIHLTVKLLSYESHGHERKGVCTHYLCNLIPTEEPIIPLFIQPHNGFTVPKSGDTPIIMVGPGTGVAPFRAFMQERIARGDEGKNWLFFGEWNRDHHFLYRDYWFDLEKKGLLRVSAAFSRDQEHKIYVQDLLKEHGREIFQLLEEGAVFYVCGDAKKMAKDVDKTLHEIVSVWGNFLPEATKEYMKNLRKDKRYLRDVY